MIEISNHYAKKNLKYIQIIYPVNETQICFSSIRKHYVYIRKNKQNLDFVHLIKTMEQFTSIN